MGEWRSDEDKTLIVPEKVVGDPGKSYIFLYIVPANVAGRWESQLQVGGRTVPYVFDFDQEFQVVEGKVRVGERDAKLPIVRMNGDEMAFAFTSEVGGAKVSHRFRGWVKGDTIEGNVSMGGDGVGQRVVPWSAKQTARGQMRMGSDGVPEGGK
jgi:hypothetical protein